MGATRDGRIELTKVDENSWRVCDGALPHDDPRRVVAFVECRGKHVGVLWLRSGARESTYPTLESALKDVERVVLADDLVGERSRRPIAIPHFPPTRREARA